LRIPNQKPAQFLRGFNIMFTKITSQSLVVEIGSIVFVQELHKGLREIE
jgi:hypothetical protein